MTQSEDYRRHPSHRLGEGEERGVSWQVMAHEAPDRMFLEVSNREDLAVLAFNKPFDTRLLWFGSGVLGSLVFLVGPVSKDVAKVVIEVDGRQALAAMKLGENTDLSTAVYFLVLPEDLHLGILRWLTAVDERGSILERHPLRFPAPPLSLSRVEIDEVVDRLASLSKRDLQREMDFLAEEMGRDNHRRVMDALRSKNRRRST